MSISYQKSLACNSADCRTCFNFQISSLADYEEEEEESEDFRKHAIVYLLIFWVW